MKGALFVSSVCRWYAHRRYHAHAIVSTCVEGAVVALALLLMGIGMTVPDVRAFFGPCGVALFAASVTRS